MTTHVGVIGLGLMGAPMARNLRKAGFPVTVWNRTASKMAPLVAEGATGATSPRELAATCPVIITMVTDAPHVREVVFGPQGIIHTAQPGTTLIDTSSIAPTQAKAIAAALAEKGIHMLDAPVSGGPEGATKGTLSIMVGGDEDVFNAMQPVLQALGATIRRVGPQGAGQLVKLCNQVACALNILAMCEAFSLAKSGGADLGMVREMLMGGAAGSWMFTNWGPKIINGDFSPGFTVVNMLKDMRNVLLEAEACNIPLPGTALVTQLLRANMAVGEEQEANIALYKTLRRLAGEDVE